MAGEFCHATAGTQLSTLEWTGTTSHTASGQVLGDTVYCDGNGWVRKADKLLINPTGTADDVLVQAAITALA